MKKLNVIGILFLALLYTSTQANADIKIKGPRTVIPACVLDVDCGPGGCSVVILDCSDYPCHEVHYQCNMAPPESSSGCDYGSADDFDPSQYQCTIIQ